MAKTVKIPGYVKIIMAVSAIFMPIFLILPFFFWTGTNTTGQDLDSTILQAGRLAPVGQLTVGDAAPASAAAPVALDAQKTYDSVCAACHGTGVSGAPKLGDTAAWQAKLDERGSPEKLAEQAIKGINAMPPKGGTTLSDDDFKKMVAFMLEHAKLDSGDLPKAGGDAAKSDSTAPEKTEERAEDKAATGAEVAASDTAEKAADDGASKQAQAAVVEQAASAHLSKNNHPETTNSSAESEKSTDTSAADAAEKATGQAPNTDTSTNDVKSEAPTPKKDDNN